MIDMKVEEKQLGDSETEKMVENAINKYAEENGEASANVAAALYIAVNKGETL